jgi:Rad3-related DNA helicase
MTIHEHIPAGYTPRTVQSDYFKWLEENWDKFDVLAVSAPTACGKSLMNVTTALWQSKTAFKQVAMLAPRKNLQDQITNEFTWMSCLKGMSAYVCDNCIVPGANCRAVKQLYGKVCGEDCKYIRARNTAKNADIALFNFHSYFVNEMHKDVAIIDEGHGTIDLLYSLFEKHLWQVEVGYPDDIEVNAKGVANFLGELIQNMTDRLGMMMNSKTDPDTIEKLQQEIESLDLMRTGLNISGDDFIIKKKKGMYYGEAKQFRKTEQEYLYIKTTKIDKLAEKVLWPRNKVSKIILTSATISKDDIELLGLDKGRRVAYYTAESPIPVDNRLILIDPVASMSYRNRQEAYPKIYKKILDIANTHKGQKGVVHATYDVARELKARLGEGGRFLFHDNTNKDQVLKAFMASKGDKILVASGMAEGIDLKDDLARFQVIVMLQFPSLQDDVMQWMAREHPRRYRWMAIRNLIQQAGRIVRTETDYGVTYVIGSEMNKGFFMETRDMWPEWFVKAMVWLG